MRTFLAIFAFLLLAALSILGLRGALSRKPPLEVFPDMDRQAKFHPQAGSSLFPDGRSDRPAPAGTVPHLTALQEHYPFLQPRDRFHEDRYLATGQLADGSFGRGFPVPVTHQLLARGQNRYNLFCQPCHGLAGDGQGITKRYGMAATPTYHDERLRALAEGEIFHTITHGKNTMLPYGAKLPVEDRWAVVAYLRALQLSQNARLADVPENLQKDFQP